jgi:hypothetical protein
MSNVFAVGSQQYLHGYLGYYRRVHKASNEVIKDERGKQVIFPTRDAAEAAAGRALTKYLNREPCCTGLIPPKHRQEAEKLFSGKVEA